MILVRRPVPTQLTLACTGSAFTHILHLPWRRALIPVVLTLHHESVSSRLAVIGAGPWASSGRPKSRRSGIRIPPRDVSNHRGVEKSRYALAQRDDEDVRCRQ
jgi:hypothetical protein